MDLAYDAITQSSFASTADRATTPTPPKPLRPSDPSDPSSAAAETSDHQSTPRPPPRQNLQTELQETFRAFSNSTWGTKLGGWWSNTAKQSQSYYEEAVKEAEDLRVDALKGFNDLKHTIVTRTRGMSGGNDLPSANLGREEQEKPAPASEGREAIEAEENKVQDTEGFLKRFRAEAAKRLKEVQKAEDAADEALLRFGTNIRNFLRDAVVITEPEDEQQGGEVLFESKDQSGKRVVHASRLDGQLYVIHTTPERFELDPPDEGGQWSKFKQDFDVEAKTEDIAKDLERYPELREMMDKTKETVEYRDFWTRYYYLRMVLEAQEERRKELLRASTNENEEVSWDENSDDEAEKPPSTPQVEEPRKPVAAQNQTPSSATLQHATTGSLKPEGRRSHDEKSVADSEASYDIVSGAPSRAASSPKEKTVQESDEEDWE